MNMVKDLLTREEQRYIKKILEILPEDAPIAYEVWAIGYYNKTTTDVAFLLQVFNEPEEAVEYAKLGAIRDAMQVVAEADFDINVTHEINRISVEVETVIDNNENGTVNICTIYKNTFTIKS
jgi:hypothetical protein